MQDARSGCGDAYVRVPRCVRDNERPVDGKDKREGQPAPLQTGAGARNARVQCSVNASRRRRPNGGRLQLSARVSAVAPPCSPPVLFSFHDVLEGVLRTPTTMTSSSLDCMPKNVETGEPSHGLA
jgi:hypothetical protein